MYAILGKKKYTSYVTYKKYKYSIPKMYFKSNLLDNNFCLYYNKKQNTIRYK